MNQLTQDQVDGVNGGVLESLFGITEIGAGMTTFAVGSALVAVAGAGWAVGSWIANHGGAEVGGKLLCEATGNC